MNGEPVGDSGQQLRPGDVVNFGKRVAPPEFEFIFEAPPAPSRVELQEAGQAEKHMDHDKMKKKSN